MVQGLDHGAQKGMEQGQFVLNVIHPPFEQRRGLGKGRIELHDQAMTIRTLPFAVRLPGADHACDVNGFVATMNKMHPREKTHLVPRLEHLSQDAATHFYDESHWAGQHRRSTPPTQIDACI